MKLYKSTGVSCVEDFDDELIRDIFEYTFYVETAMLRTPAIHLVLWSQQFHTSISIPPYWPLVVLTHVDLVLGLVLRGLQYELRYDTYNSSLQQWCIHRCANEPALCARSYWLPIISFSKISDMTCYYPLSKTREDSILCTLMHTRRIRLLSFNLLIWKSTTWQDIAALTWITVF